MEQWVHYSITVRREGKTDRLSYALVHGKGPMPRVLSYSKALAQDGRAGYPEQSRTFYTAE
jgi:hypothetical protein